MQNESQLSKEILDCFVVVNTDQMGNARYDIDFNKLSKEFATARAEGAAEERKRIKKWLLENQTLETPDLGKLVLWGWIYEVVNNKQALTTKEHHAE